VTADQIGGGPDLEPDRVAGEAGAGAAADGDLPPWLDGSRLRDAELLERGFEYRADFVGAGRVAGAREHT
jgi:hypothetical protein